MTSSLNCDEKTPAEFRPILEKSDWKLGIIHRALVGHYKLLEIIPSLSHLKLLYDAVSPTMVILMDSAVYIIFLEYVIL